MRLSEIPTAEAEAIIKSWVAYHGPIGPEACIPDPTPAYIRGFLNGIEFQRLRRRKRTTKRPPGDAVGVLKMSQE